jgi:hypothetical protein
MEQKRILDFTGNKENTMNAVLSASVVTALRALAQEYLAKTSEPISLLCRDALIEIKAAARAIASYKTEDQEEREANFLAAIAYIEAKISEPLCPLLDIVTLYNHGKYTITLAEVLVLVWKALNDNRKYAQHSAESENEELAAEKDKANRLLSFFNCLVQLNQHPVCHQGIRHELTFLINKIYPGINIIEDPMFTILSYLKEKIFNQFINGYTAANSEKRKQLMSGLITWMMECKVDTLLKEMDNNFCKQLYEELDELFVHHGSNPKQLIPLIDQALSYLEFSCDPQAYPQFANLNYLLNEAPDQCQIRSAALTQVIEHIPQVEPDTSEHCLAIEHFCLMYQAHKEMTKYASLIAAHGFTDAINQVLLLCEKYFKEWIAKKDFLTVTPNLIERIQEGNQILEEIRQNKLTALVENFFAHWFIAEKQYDRSAQKKLYQTILLDETENKKILLSDSEIKYLMRSNTAVGEKEITPYEINRIFLHAILKRPEEWSSLFYDAFAKVLQFVKDNFNLNTEVAFSLNRDSYPADLLNQLDYLQKCFKALIEKEEIQSIERPHRQMILLPENIRTGAEWILLVKILQSDGDETLWKQIYLRNSVHIQSILSKSEENVRSKIQSIPTAYRRDFIRSELLAMNTRDSYQLYAYLTEIPKEERYDILQSLGEKLNQIIKTGKQLNFIIRTLPLKDRYKLLQSIGESCREVIKHFSIVKELLEKIPGNEYEFLKLLGKKLPKIIGFFSDFQKIISIVPKRNLLEFLQSWGEELNKFIEDKYYLDNILEEIPSNYHFEFIQSLGEKFYEMVESEFDLFRFTMYVSKSQKTLLKEELEKYNNKIGRNSLNPPPVVSTEQPYQFKSVPPALKDNFYPLLFSNCSRAEINPLRSRSFQFTEVKIIRPGLGLNHKKGNEDECTQSNQGPLKRQKLFLESPGEESQCDREKQPSNSKKL